MKRTFLYIISVVLLFSFTACGVAIPNDGATIEKTATGTQTSVESITSEQDTSDKMDETEPVAEDQTKEVEAMIAPDVYSTLDEFVTQWHQKDINNKQANGVQNIETELSLMVPILKCPDYELFAIEVLETQYYFYYKPVGVEQLYVDIDTNILVHISFENGAKFETVARQFGFPSEGKTSIYVPTQNFWILDIDDNIEGNMAGVHFPKTIQVLTEEELYEYFSFEMRTFTGTLAEEQ